VTGTPTGGVQNPLQLFGLYLAWAETALGGALFALQNVNHWTKYLLIVTMAFGVIVWVSVTAFLLIHIVTKKPGFLFNPSDYDKTVQHLLFNAPGPIIPAPPPE